jgi:tol-pal system protein YbgF
MIRQRLLVSVLACGMAFAPLSAGAQIFGPSDEEKAHEAGQDQGIKDLQDKAQAQDDRIKGLEDKVQGLTQSLSQATGVNEDLSHQIQVQNDKIDRMQKDFAYRLCQLSAQQLGAGDAMNCSGGGAPASGGAMAPQPYSQMQGSLAPGQALPPINATGNGTPGFVAAPPPPADTDGMERGRSPGVLGTLPMGSGPMGSGPGPAASAVPPVSSPQYDQAMNLMRRAQYDEASASFRAYADSNPGDALAPQAIYWVANISFIRQDYATAARTFAEVIKKYPKSQPASEAMLKLAQSFMAMGQKSEGCTTLGLIKTKYPDASPQTLTQAASLRKTACTK